MSIQIASRLFHNGIPAEDVTLMPTGIATALISVMATGPKDSVPQPDASDGLIAEVVRRVLRKPTFAAADPIVLRELALAELHKGTHTIFGLVRAVERGL